MSNEISRRNLLKLSAGAATALGMNWIFRATDDGRVVKAQTEGAIAFKPEFFSDAEIQQLAAVCETIIPRTDTPGARDARVHEYIDVAMTVEAESSSKRFRDGLAWLEGYCKKETKKSLAEANADQLITLLTSISDDNASVKEDARPGATFFTDVKTRTIFGYYTSREGWVEELGRPEHIGMEKFVGGCEDADQQTDAHTH